MKKIVTIVWLLITVTLTSKVDAQNIAINEDGSSPDASSIMDIKSSNKGLLVPRMSTFDMNNSIVSPAKGLLIYNSQTNLFMVNIGTSSSPLWTAVGGASGGAPSYTFNTGTSGTDFNIVTSGTDNTFNIPDASATARGLLTTGVQTIAGNKTITGNSTFSGTITATSLGTGAASDYVLTADASGVLKKTTSSTFFNNVPSDVLTFAQYNFEDFVFDAYAGSGSNDNQFAFTKSLVNGGVCDVDGTNNTTANDYAGLDSIGTGTTNNSTGVGALGSFNFVNKIKLGGKQVIWEARVKIPTLATSGAGNFIAYFGLMDLTTMTTTVCPTGDPTNGIYYKYSLGSTSWQAISRSASSSTSTTTGVSVTANTWYKLKAVISNDGQQIEYYIDDVLIGTNVNSNIPTVAMKFVFKIEKTGGTNSTSNRSAYIDYLGWRMVR